MWRALLTTQIHDSIGGVSVDQVHNNMEAVYSTVFTEIKNLLHKAVSYLPEIFDLQPGMYGLFPSPYAYESMNTWVGGKVYRVNPKGTGIFPVELVEGQEAPRSAEIFSWQNEHYKFDIDTGTIQLNGRDIGYYSIERDLGDTYNSDPRPFEEELTVTNFHLRIVAQNSRFALLSIRRQLVLGEIRFSTEEKIFLNQSPLVRWSVDLDSWGTDYRLRFNYETSDGSSPVYAKMPFDITKRSRVDENYFGEETPDELKPVLLAARETHQVSDFPFQGFVAISGDGHARAALAQGLREYQVDERGVIGLTLRRAVEWLAKPNLETRVGDAGPYMYVPGAKSERRTRFELGFLDLPVPVHSADFLKWFYWFEFEPLIFENQTPSGRDNSVRFWNESLPWSGVQNIAVGNHLIRLYNPTPETMSLDQEYDEVDPFGKPIGRINEIPPGKFKQIKYNPSLKNDLDADTQPANVKVQFPDWPIGEDHSVIDEEKLARLAAFVANLKRELADTEESLPGLVEGADPLRFHQAHHVVYRLRREILEGEISLLLNDLERTSDPGPIKAELHKLGAALNLARRERRTYDYILSIFENQ
jgi:alpha-mannosidase